MTLMSHDKMGRMWSIQIGLRMWLTLHAPSSSRCDKGSGVDHTNRTVAAEQRTRVPSRLLRSHTRGLTLAPNLSDDSVEEIVFVPFWIGMDRWTTINGSGYIKRERGNAKSFQYLSHIYFITENGIRIDWKRKALNTN